MSRFFLLLPLLVACSSEPNPATIMVRAQLPESKCTSRGTDKDGLSLSICTLPDGTRGIAAYSVAYPFHFFVLKKPDKKAEAPQVDAGVDATVVKSDAQK